MPFCMKQTKIIATIGPSSENREMLISLGKAGVNIARINCSHFYHDEFVQKTNTINELNASGEISMAIMLDTKGPEIRTCEMNDPLAIKSGNAVIVTTPEYADRFENRLVSDYPSTISDEVVGNTIDVDCGLLHLEIQEIHDDHLVCNSYHNYTVKNRRHINLPGVELSFPGLTDQDKEHIAIGVTQGIHYVAMSFVRTADHVKECRAYLDSLGAPHVGIIAKIETLESVQNAQSIIDASDGIMVARGDLGAQIPMEELPMTQEILVDLAQETGKIVIVATNMLESMIHYPTPTRAELTDVHSAVKQRVDATMLSGETAMGDYPLETATMMSRIIYHTESIQTNKHKYFERDLGVDENKKQVTKNALKLADDVDAKAVVVFTQSGFMGKTIAALRPNQPVYAFTFSEETVRKLTLCYGVYPVLIPFSTNNEHIRLAKEYLIDNGNIQSGDDIIILVDGKADRVDAPQMQLITLP